MPAYGTTGTGGTGSRRRRRRKRKPTTIDGAVQDFMREHGPIAMRTADTPWQEKQRPKRKRKRIQRQEARERYENLERDSDSLMGDIAKAARRRGFRAGVGARADFDVDVGDGLLGDIARAAGRGVGEVGEFFVSDVPGYVQDAFPGLGDPLKGRVGAKSYNLLPEVGDSAKFAADPAARAAAQQYEVAAQGVVGEMVGGLAAVPSQWANAYLGIPGFAYMLVTDPRGTGSMMVESTIDQLKHPVANIGYLSLLAFGAAGGARGASRKLPIMTRAIRAGDFLEATRIAKGPPHRRGKYGTPKEVADGSRTRAIAFDAPESVLPPGKQGRRRGRRRDVEADLLNAEPAAAYKLSKKASNEAGMAMWAVNSAVTVSQLRDAFARSLATARNPATKRRLGKRLNEAQGALKYVDEADGRATFKPEYPELAAIQEWTARMSEEMGQKKGALAETGDAAARYGVDLGAQEARKRNQWAAITGEDPALAPVDEIVFTPGKTPRSPWRIQPSSTGATTLGVPKGEPRHRYTGKSVTEGTLDPKAGRAISREVFNHRKIVTRYDTWKEIADDPGTLTAEQLVNLINEHGMSRRQLANWRAIRVKSASNTSDTLTVLDMFFGPEDNLFSQPLGRRNPGKAMEALEKAVAADTSGQVKFFDNRKWKIRTVKLGKEQGLGRTVWQTINSLAKISVLFSKLTGYITPQVLGLTAMQIMDQGLTGPLKMAGQAPFVYRGLSKRARAMLTSVHGTGFGHALDPSGDPFNPVRAVNQALADAFNVAMDAPFRNSAVFYHAKQLGYRTAKEINGLLESKPGSKGWDDLHTIRDLVDDAYGKFSSLGPTERAIADLIWFYPWLRAASIYAVRLPMNHPVRTAIAGQGGKVSQERTEELLTVAIMRAAGLSEENANEAALALMNEYPGIFPTGEPDAQGNIDVVSPQSAALLQMPFDIKKLFDGFMGDEPLAAPLRMATPAVGLAGAALPGGYSTYFGEAMPGGEDSSALGRMAEYAKGMVPGLKLAERLTEEPSEAATFTYSPGQAIAQYGIGSVGPRGLGTKAVAERYMEEQEKGEETKAGPGRITSGEFSAQAKDAQWARDHDEVPDVVTQYAVNARKMEDRITPAMRIIAERRGLTDSGDEKLKPDYYKVKIKILNQLRPGWMEKGAQAGLIEQINQGGEAMEAAASVVNEFFSYSDKLGASIWTVIGHYRDTVASIEEDLGGE